MNTGAKCGCNHSLAVFCGVFAGGAIALFFAGRGCVSGGGRLSDTAWTCEVGGATSSLWALVTPGIAVAALLVAVVVYFAVAAAGRRWLFRYGSLQAAGQAPRRE
jgi:hypothetical protein